MLNEKQIAALQEPFKLNEHGFYQKNPYIRKSAIRDRLNHVAPGWLLLPPELIANDENVIIMRGGIQIGDIKRYAVGTGIILRATSDGVVFDGAKLAGMVSKAYKQAASDILPRAALEFGIGEYLKDKPKNINEDTFAGWLTKLTAAPVDPNAWTIETIRAWGNKWRAQGLSDAELMKALNITERWTDFKGTIAAADKAVEAYRAVQIAFTTPAADLPVIMCHINDLRPGDVIRQQMQSQTQGTLTTLLEVLEYGGKIAAGQYKLTIKNLTTGETKSVNWMGGDQVLVDGAKVQAYVKDQSLCKPSSRPGTYPYWDAPVPEFAAAVR